MSSNEEDCGRQLEELKADFAALVIAYAELEKELAIERAKLLPSQTDYYPT